MSGATRVRIVRTAINGVECEKKRVVKSFNFTGDASKQAFENTDFSTGLETKWLFQDAAEMGIQTIDDVTYTIVLGSANIFKDPAAIAGETFTVHFAGKRPVATPNVSDAAATIEGDENVVRFTADPGATKYWLAVSKDGGATFETDGGNRFRVEVVGGVANTARMYRGNANPVLFDGFRLDRDGVYELLREHEIVARKYFYPATNCLGCYKDYPTAGGEKTPVSTYAAARVLTLPLYADLKEADVDRICDIILGK